MKIILKKITCILCTACAAFAVSQLISRSELKKPDMILEDNTSSVTTVQNEYIEYKPVVYADGEYHGLININTAPKELLVTLNGVGDKTADSIIEYRNAVSGFKSIEEIKNISGIGEKKFDEIKDNICIE